ncbi:MAG: hypothetical protein WBP72_00600 [Rhodocyclaceae bacterium]
MPDKVSVVVPVLDEGAKGQILLFLPIDSVLLTNADSSILAALADPARPWGRFDVAIDGAHPRMPVIAWFMNRRSRLTGICTGDRGLFGRAETFRAHGGFPASPSNVSSLARASQPIPLGTTCPQAL